MPHRRHLPSLLLLLSAACADAPTASRPADAPAAGRAQLRCSVSVQARTLDCEPQRPAGVRAVILGGQGVHVRLTSTNVSWSAGDHVLSADVALQNLLDQPIGTDGGSGATGSRVFFLSGPTVTEGSGSAGSLADSVGVFTATNQGYYVYPGRIDPRGVSLPIPWRFEVDPSVVRFEFLVAVDTRVPVESGILHFRPEAGPLVYGSILRSAWAASEHDVFAVTDGTVLHFDGNYWRAMDAPAGCGCTTALQAVWGSSARDVFAVGAGGTVAHWTGGEWTGDPDPDLGSDDLYAVWGTSPSNVWAVGDNGRIVHFDGGDWTSAGSPALTTARLRGGWGSGPDDVWAVGLDGQLFNGVLLHYDGTAWTRIDRAIIGDYLAIWGTAANDVWIAGSSSLMHYDGSSWRAVSPPGFRSGETLYAGWSGGPNDVWITTVYDPTATSGVWHWNGTRWSYDPIGGDQVRLFGIAGAGTQVFAVGDWGTVMRRSDGAWKQMGTAGEVVRGIWGASPDEVWAVGGASIRHREADGSWTTQNSTFNAGFSGVWGVSPTQVWAVSGSGDVWRYDGPEWTSIHHSEAIAWETIWGASASDVWVGGTDGNLLHWDGAAWSPSSAGTGDVRAIWGSAAGNVFAANREGEIRRWNGSSWTLMDTGGGPPLNGLWGSGPDDVYAVGENGTVLHYDGNASLAWTPVATPADPAGSVTAIWGSGPDDVYIATDNGLRLVHWDGAAWKVLTSLSPNANVWMYALWGSDSRNLYAGGDVGLILHGRR
jgi:hypothetical protein